MVGVYESKTANCGVTNLGNGLAITCDLCLAFGDFESHIHSTRINQRFLKVLIQERHLQRVTPRHIMKTREKPWN